MNLKMAAAQAGINEITLRSRLSRGWDIEKALTVPVQVQVQEKRRPTANHSGETYQGCTLLYRTPYKTSRQQIYRTRCHCGNEFYVDYQNLKKGITRSCGCRLRAKSRERMNEIHNRRIAAILNSSK